MLQSIVSYQHSADNFMGSLVQANLQPLMQEMADTDAYLEALQPDIARIASSLLYTTFTRGIERDDLVQEGLIGAWEATQHLDTSRSHYEQRAYCLRAARNKMCSYLTKFTKTVGDSIDLEPEQWLTVPAVAEAPAPATFTRKRKNVLSMLRNLPRRERLVIMAHYGMVSTGNRICITRQALQTRHNLTNRDYNNIKYRALKKLSSLPCPC